MSTAYCTIKFSHNVAYHYSPLYRCTVDVVYTCITRVTSEAVLATCHKVIYIALEACPRLFIVAIPTTVMFLRGLSFEDISPAFIGASTWILFGILSVFYPWDVLTNLNEMSRQKKLGSAIPNTPVIEKMVTFLGDSRSILLHGPTGSGKSAQVRALVELIESDKCPPALKNKEIISLSLEEMLADHGAFLQNLVAVLKVVRLNPNAILCIDEVHRLTQSIHGVKISDTLKLYFENEGSQGKNLFVQAIGITTTDEKEKITAQEIAFLRRFFPVSMSTDKNEELDRQIIKGKFPSLALIEEVVTEAITVAQKRFPRIALPASAIRVLESVMAWKKRKNDTSTVTVDNISQVIEEGLIETIV
jgi:ATP-dependent Clp protease ATP-binding subunit ClpA